MARIKYYYDTETCKYERYKVGYWDQFLSILGIVFMSICFGGLIFYVYISFFESPIEAKQKKEIQELTFYYDMMQKELDDAQKVLSALEERDDNIYRVIFEAEPIPNTVREAGYGGSNRYEEILSKDITNDQLIIHTKKKIDKLKKKMYIQTKSYDEIIELAKNKEKLWASIPAIQPVSNKNLTRLASGYGLRIHPIYKVKRMHWGVDFSAPRGTPIYSTGDGKVKRVVNKYAGFGKHVVIDHGFGYESLYAHMKKYVVKKGQKIKRGELIGYIGNTGTSTAPHLHYEVTHNGKKVNPVYYFFNDLKPEEFEKILQLASVENQSL